MLSNATSYWDQQTAAIENAAKRLEALPSEAQASAIEALEAAIRRHGSVLDDNLVGSVGWIMTEDLYKAVCVTPYWNDALHSYLAATSGTLCSVLSTRGITLNYVIDNVYEVTLLGMRAPIGRFPRWFQAAGFVYLCPQAIALELMTRDGLCRDSFAELLARYAGEATHVAGLLVARCHEERRHFVYLDADSTQESLSQALTKRGEQGFIVGFRDQPPLPGTKSIVWRPPGMHWPGDGS